MATTTPKRSVSFDLLLDGGDNHGLSFTPYAEPASDEVLVWVSFTSGGPRHRGRITGTTDTEEGTRLNIELEADANGNLIFFPPANTDFS
jgi:hypothetical protein